MTYILDLEKLDVYVIDSDLSDDTGQVIYDRANQEIKNTVIANVLAHADLTDAPTGAHHSATDHESGGTLEITHNNLTLNSSDHHTRPSAGTLLEDATNTFNVLESNISHDNIDQATVSAGDHHSATDHESGGTLEITHNNLSLNAGDHHSATDHESGGTLEITAENLASAITNDQVLIGDGAGGLQTAPYVEPEDIRNVTSVTSSVTASEGDIALADASGGAITVTLPTPSKSDVFIDVKKVDSSSNTVTVDTAGAETIDGADTKTIDVQYENLSFVSDGTDWFVL